MPFYEYDLSVAAGTTKAAPAELTAALTKGVVTSVEVVFPPGCAGLVFAVLDRGDVQLWPSNRDGEFKGDGDRIRWVEDYELDDEPLGFNLRAWAPNARFRHTVTFRLEVGGGGRNVLGRIADAFFGDP